MFTRTCLFIPSCARNHMISSTNSIQSKPCLLIVLYFTFLQDINRKRIAQISCSFVKDNNIEFQGVKVCKHLISLLLETSRPSLKDLDLAFVSDFIILFLSQGKMKQGDFWTALLQNTKRLPPRSVPHQLRTDGTHFPSQ